MSVCGFAPAHCVVLFGLYAGMGQRDRIMVLMSILGAERSIEFEVEDVIRV